MNDLLRPRIWPSFSPSCRLYEPEAWRPRVFLRQAQDRLPLRRTVQVRLEFEPLRVPGGTLIFTVSRHRIIEYPGWADSSGMTGSVNCDIVSKGRGDSRS